MGVVHLAQTLDGRRVALKVLRPHVVGDAEARERLAREVSSLRLVTSPRVAEILDADPHGPTPYVVTRYVPGLSLYHHVAEEGPIAGRDLVHFADSLAEALQAVHSVGVLHRDIKPTNVLMEGRSPVLIDFGLARLADDPRLTQTGFLLGTPGYLAPEILYGEDGTPAADVHAWAATVAFAATGRPPYGRGPAMAVMDRVRRGEHDLSGVPEGLAQGVARMPGAGAVAAADAERGPGLAGGAAGAAPGGAGRRARALDDALLPRGAHEHPAGGSHPADGDRAPLHAPVERPSVAEPAQPAVRGSEDARHPGVPAQPSAQPSAHLLPSWLPVAGAVTAAIGSPAGRAASARDSSRVQQVLQLLGLGALRRLDDRLRAVRRRRFRRCRRAGAAPGLGRPGSATPVGGCCAGRPAWYDVPATTLSLPVYLLVALAGSLVLLFGAAFTALGMYSLGYVLGQPVRVDLVLAGWASCPRCGGVPARHACARARAGSWCAPRARSSGAGSSSRRACWAPPCCSGCSSAPGRTGRRRSLRPGTSCADRGIFETH